MSCCAAIEWYFMLDRKYLVILLTALHIYKNVWIKELKVHVRLSDMYPGVLEITCVGAAVGWWEENELSPSYGFQIMNGVRVGVTRSSCGQNGKK